VALISQPPQPPQPPPPTAASGVLFDGERRLKTTISHEQLIKRPDLNE